MTWLEESKRANEEKWKHDIAKIVHEELFKPEKKKEATTVQVTYNGFTGKLLKMELVCENYYDITIYDVEKEAKVSFSGVNLDGVKFMGGAVSFGG